MKDRLFMLAIAAAAFAALDRIPPTTAQTSVFAHVPHNYTAYEKLIRENVSQFHKNFNNRQFPKNGDLVVDDVHVTSNGKEFHGRDAFVKQIARFAIPFPDVQITDLSTVVDGNTAAIRFVITGTHKGDLETPEGVIHATNRPIKVDGIEYFVFDREGKLTELVTVEDMALLSKQIKGVDGK